MWKNMQEKAPDELTGGECHCPLPVRPIASIVFVPKGHSGFIKGDEPAVGYGDTMGVARQVGEHCLWAREWRLGIGNPILFSERRDVAKEGTPLVKVGLVAEELDMAGGVKLD